MEKENLCSHTAAMGDCAISRLREIQQQNPLIGNVRGLGLMIGIELIKDKMLTPAASEAEAVRDACLRNGLLVGVGGIEGNVIRFQPPLVISKSQIDQALDIFSKALQEVATAK